MKPLRIAVSGINAADNPGPGVGVARSLKEAMDVEILGLAYDAMEPGIYMDWVIDKSYIMPYPSCGGEEYMERLFYIKESRGLDFVIPSLDAELPTYIRYADRLAERGIGCFLPDMKQFRLRGKDRLPLVAESIGLKVPPTLVVNSQKQLREAAEALGYPLMVKGLFYQAKKAHNLQEAEHHFNQIAAEWGYPIILQKVIHGQELNLMGLGDGRGGQLGSIGIKKICITSLGKIWTGVTVRHQGMLEAADAFVSKFRWRGPYELECMLCDDGLYLIEINPRFPAWSYFSTGVGLNLPERMVQTATHKPLKDVKPYPAGKLFVRYSADVVTDMSDFQTLVTQGETNEQLSSIVPAAGDQPTPRGADEQVWAEPRLRA